MSHLMVVLSNARPGRDEEFNDWYSRVHVVDTVTKLAGFASGQRYVRADFEEAPDHPYRYLAMYEVKDLELAYAQFRMQRRERSEAVAAGRPPLIPVSDAIAPDVLVGFFSALGERVTPDLAPEA